MDKGTNRGLKPKQAKARGPAKIKGAGEVVEAMATAARVTFAPGPPTVTEFDGSNPPTQTPSGTAGTNGKAKHKRRRSVEPSSVLALLSNPIEPSTKKKRGDSSLAINGDGAVSSAQDQRLGAVHGLVRAALAGHLEVCSDKHGISACFVLPAMPQLTDYCQTTHIHHTHTYTHMQGTSEQYATLVQQVQSGDLGVLRNVYSAMPNHVSMLGATPTKYRALLDALFNFPWTDDHPDVVASYISFLLHVVSANTTLVVPAFRALARNLVPDGNWGCACCHATH